MIISRICIWKIVDLIEFTLIEMEIYIPCEQSKRIFNQLNWGNKSPRWETNQNCDLFDHTRKHHINANLPSSSGLLSECACSLVLAPSTASSFPEENCFGYIQQQNKYFIQINIIANDLLIKELFLVTMTDHGN